MRFIKEYRPLYKVDSSYNLHLYLIQFLTFGYFFWRIGSRNFTQYGLLTAKDFSFENYSFFLEISSFFPIKIVTFQFIYEFIDRPGVETIAIFQYIVLCSCTLGALGVFPRFMARVALVIGLHLTGFMLMTNAPVDGGALVLSSLLILSIIPKKLFYRIGYFKPTFKRKNNMWPVYLFIFIVGSFYTMSGLNKILDCGPFWPYNLHLELLAQSSVERAIFKIDRSGSGFWGQIFNNEILSIIGGVITLVGEIGFVSIILIPRYRQFFVLTMILLHYFVLKMAGINFLGNSILLLLCLDWNVFLKKITVYYDQDCGFCTKSVFFIKRFTFNKKIHFLPNASNTKLSSKKLKAAIGALDEDGQA